MRLIYFSPDIDPMMGTTFDDYRSRQKSISKFSFLIIESLRQQGSETYFYVKNGRGIFSIKILNKLKFLYWAWINDYSIKWSHILDADSSFGDGDVLLCNVRRCLKDDSLELFNRYPMLKKVAILDHYMADTSKIATNSKKYKIDAYIASSNLYKTSNFFKKHFSFVNQDVYVLPHVAEARFVKKSDFCNRLNKAFVAGSIAIFDRSEPYLKDFFDFFPDSVYQPMRREIYDQAESLQDFIDHKLYITYAPSLINQCGNEMVKKYRSDFDMVDSYNSYKMFLAPEELSGLSAIAFIEGLNCGSVFIGKKGAMYEDLGFRDGVTYISYDGTLTNLCQKIAYYQERPADLSEIAKNSHLFCINKFNQTAVYKNFYQDLLDYKHSGQLISSFVKP